MSLPGDRAISSIGLRALGGHGPIFSKCAVLITNYKENDRVWIILKYITYIILK
jgi:hypothetical protein